MSKYSVGTVTRRPSCTKLVSGAYTKQTYNIFGAESNNTKVLGESNKDNVAPISQNAEESAPIKQSTRVAPGGKSSEDNILAHPSASPNNTRKTPKKYSSQTLPRGWAQSSNIFDSNAPEVAQKRSSIRVTNSRPRGNDIFNSVTDENVPAPSHTSVHVSPTLGAGKSSNIFSTEGAAPFKTGRKVMMAPPGQAKEAFDHETPLPPHVVKADPMRVSHVFGAAEEDNNTPRSSTKRMFAPGGPSNVFSDAPVEQKRSIATARINESSNIFAAAGSPPKPKYDSNKKNVSHNILAGPAEEDNLTPRSRYESNKKNVSANVLNLGGDVPSAAEPTKHSVHNRMMESSIFSGKMESDNAPQRSSTRVLGGAGGGKSNIFDA